jgi:hypothetical protein
MRLNAAIALGAAMAVAACVQPVGIRSVCLDRGLTLLEQGPIYEASGTLSRSAGFAHASVVIQAAPAVEFDVHARWRLGDATVVPDDPADRRRLLTGPAGIGTLTFIAPSMSASELLIEMAPADPTDVPQSRF